jgi:hypothetical protein
LWEYVKDRVFVPPLATNLDDLKNRITAAVTSVEEDEEGRSGTNSTIV